MTRRTRLNVVKFSGEMIVYTDDDIEQHFSTVVLQGDIHVDVIVPFKVASNLPVARTWVFITAHFDSDGHVIADKVEVLS